MNAHPKSIKGLREGVVALAVIAAALMPVSSSADASDAGFEPIGKARLVSRSHESNQVVLSRHAHALAYAATPSPGWSQVMLRERGQEDDVLVS